MADFTLEFVAGTSPLIWTDPAPLVIGKPSRLNPVTGTNHILEVKDTGSDVELGARVGGVLQPLDAALGGRLFLWSWLDLPQGVPLSIIPVAGQTSKLVIPSGLFTGPTQGGHYTILCTRDDGGAVAISWETPVL